MLFSQIKRLNQWSREVAGRMLVVPLEGEPEGIRDYGERGKWEHGETTTVDEKGHGGRRFSTRGCTTSYGIQRHEEWLAGDRYARVADLSLRTATVRG